MTIDNEGDEFVSAPFDCAQGERPFVHKIHDTSRMIVAAGVHTV